MHHLTSRYRSRQRSQLRLEMRISHGKVREHVNIYIIPHFERTIPENPNGNKKNPQIHANTFIIGTSTHDTLTKYKKRLKYTRSRDSSVGIVTGRVRFPAVQDFSFLHSVQTDSEANPASYAMGNGGSFTGG
jgi:hypothetical protein